MPNADHRTLLARRRACACAFDLSDLLRLVGERNEPFPVPHGRGDETTHRGGPDQGAADGLGRKPRDVYIPDLRLGTGIKVPTRNFR